MCTYWSSVTQISNFKFSGFFRVLFALWSLKYPQSKSQQTPWVSTELEMLANLSYSFIHIHKILQKGVDRPVKPRQKRVENSADGPERGQTNSARACADKMPLCWIGEDWRVLWRKKSGRQAGKAQFSNQASWWFPHETGKDSLWGFCDRNTLSPSNNIFALTRAFLKEFSLFVRDDQRFCKKCFRQRLIAYQTPMFYQYLFEIFYCWMMVTFVTFLLLCMCKGRLSRGKADPWNNRDLSMITVF